MKKIWLFLVFTLFSLSSVRASDILRMGLTAGGNISKASSDGKGVLGTGWNDDMETGFYAGLTMRISLPIVNLGIDASALYSQENVTLPTAHGSVTNHLRYFSVPLHLRYDLELPAIREVVIPYVFVGPQCNFALNELKWYQEMDKDATKNITELEKQNWKFDLGFGVILFKHLQVAYNYAVPLNDTFHLDTANDEVSDNFKLGTHRVGLTFYF